MEKTQEFNTFFESDFANYDTNLNDTQLFIKEERFCNHEEDNAENLLCPCGKCGE